MMKLSIKPYLIIPGMIILAFVIIGIWRNFMPAKSPEQWDNQYGSMMKPVVFGLFFLFGLTIIPVGLKLFIIMQQKAGNINTTTVRWVSDNAKLIVVAVWSVFILGLCAALPFMIKDGFFTTNGQSQNKYKLN